MIFNWIQLNDEEKRMASEKVSIFLNLIQHPQRRISYAEKFHKYDIAMDVSASPMNYSELFTWMIVYFSLSLSDVI
jgi:hypothetical protein